MHARRQTRTLVQRFQGLPPTGRPQDLRQHAERHGKPHPRPIHPVVQRVPQPVPVEITVHPPQNQASQHQGKGYFE